ncbi:response regulator [Massilia glaciei]|uniref:Response regulator n=1 Tax=Massilia glaciei TaxID=1524097 RepID=A0A2U2HII7_9BURK|nr:response regulator [Massilia glaciei]PWF46108.1 response regulator [Massilia glaciei]
MSGHGLLNEARQSDRTHWLHKRYLIVDDLASLRDVLRASLQKLGATTIDYASSGREAIALLIKKRFDVVLCACHLGEGSDGQQVLEEARARELLLPSGVWVMLSPEQNTESIMGVAEQQPDAYLIMPLTERDVIARLALIWQTKRLFKPIDAAFAEKDYRGAADECETQIAANLPHETELLRLKASLLLKGGEAEMARQCFERVLLGRGYQWARAGLAKIRMANGEFEQACQMFQSVIAENRLYIEAYDQLAIAHQNMGRSRQACDVLERATILSPNSVARQRSLGQVSLKLGLMNLAERAFRKCIAVGQHSIMKSPDAYLGLARVCGLKNDPQEAMRLLTTARSDFAGDGIELRVKIAEGLVHHESGNAPGARLVGEELEHMLRRGAQRPDMVSCIEMASLMLAVGLREAAVEQLRYITRNNHDNSSLIEEVQRVFERASMRGEGEALIAAARKEATDLMNRGVLLWKTGKALEALAWMRNARTVLPDNLRILFNAAQILVSHLQQSGFDQELANEAGEILMHVDRIAPGQRRFSLLMDQLAKVVPLTPTKGEGQVVA